MGSIDRLHRALLSEGWKGSASHSIGKNASNPPVATFFNYADPAMEEALYEVPLYCEFADIDLAVDTVPDETTICKFRHLLERHDLAAVFLKEINAELESQGLLLKQGTVVDATLIAAPPSTKNGK